MGRSVRKAKRSAEPDVRLPDEFAYLENAEIYSAVVLGAMANAKRRLDIATANLKDMHVESGRRFTSIVDLLDRLAAAGVQIRLLHAGRPSEPFLDSLRRSQLLEQKTFTMTRCVRVHFKAVIVDGSNVYLGSANISGAGMGAKGDHRRNFEIGFLTDDTYIRQRVSSLFNRIWDGEFCAKCQRRRQCVRADILDKSR